MITIRPLTGLMANCTLEPPVSTPISRRHAIAASRIIWYSRSVSVCAGATVMESPVCTPIASKFSIEQTMMQLSAKSRITSNSNSFQPSALSSISTSWTGESASPRSRISSRSSLLYAMPPPVPPSVKLGRTMHGKPIRAANSCPRCKLLMSCDSGVSRPILRIASLNRSRSSAFLMASILAPISSTPYFSSIPASASSTARFSPVCPPTVESSASGRSRRMISSRYGTVSGST
jgi:hypothetical protein